MATKKPGGSNLGLIITLVFFVLTTVVLGITTYLGYSDQEKLVNEKKKAEEDAKKANSERDVYRYLYVVTRALMGKKVPANKNNPMSETAVMAKYKEQHLAGTLAFAKSHDDAKEFGDVLKEWTREGGMFPWKEGAEEPAQTYESRLQEKDNVIKAKQAEVDQKEKDVKVARAEAATNLSKLTAARKQYDADIDAQKDKAAADQKVKTDAIEARDKDILKEGDAKRKAEGTVARLGDAIKKLEGEKDKLFADLSKDRKEREKIQTLLDEIRNEYEVLKQETGKSLDDKDLEDRRLNEEARKELRNWDVKRHNWKIVDLDRTGTRPYINLGSADGLQPQVTFNVHELGPDGRLKEIPKGKLEVVRIVGPHLALARITVQATKSEREKNPITKGDYLFNHQWSPFARKRVFLAGLADMNGTGSDSTREFKQLLKRQGVDLVGEIKASNEKGLPTQIGDVNSRVDYLILGETLDDVNHPRRKEAQFKAEFSKLQRTLRDKARNIGVPVLTLRKYLQMIGYVAPSVEGKKRDY